MNELVILKNRQALTTSLKVAEVFEKSHKDVLEKIRFWRRKFPPRNLKTVTILNLRKAITPTNAARFTRCS